MGKIKDLTPRKVSAVKTLIKEQRYSQREIAKNVTFLQLLLTELKEN